MGTKHGLIRFLYWYCEWIKVRTLARLLNCNIREVYKNASPLDIRIRCDRCFEPILAKSRSDRKRLDSIKKDGRQWPEGYLFVCDKCRHEIFHERSLEHQATESNNKNRLEELRSMPYQEYLQTIEWDMKRKQALKRAHYHCQICNGDGVLHVHHRTYENRGSEGASDLLVLCASCHEHFHLGDHSE